MTSSHSLLNISITICTIFGAVLFNLGSIVYLPGIYQSLNKNAGGLLYTSGSVFYTITDVLCARADPEFNPLRPWDNIGSLKALLVAIGNIAYIVGSVYFFPEMPYSIGDYIFIVASIFTMIPQVQTIYAVTKKTPYT